MTYVTHPNPPANDDSQKIATTAWVKDITDSLEASVSGGMFPTVSRAELSGNNIIAPRGGTWWVYHNNGTKTMYNEAKAGGTSLYGYTSVQSDIMCIKIV